MMCHSVRVQAKSHLPPTSMTRAQVDIMYIRVYDICTDVHVYTCICIYIRMHIYIYFFLSIDIFIYILHIDVHRVCSTRICSLCAHTVMFSGTYFCNSCSRLPCPSVLMLKQSVNAQQCFSGMVGNYPDEQTFCLLLLPST